MEETLRNRLILVLGILTVIFFIGTVGSCSNAHRQKVARDREMATRLELEENMNKFIQEKGAIQEKVNTLSRELEEEKVAHQASKKALLQEQLVNQSLKEELGKVIKLKEALEEDLKEALVESKKSRK